MTPLNPKIALVLDMVARAKRPPSQRMATDRAGVPVASASAASASMRAAACGVMQAWADGAGGAD